MKNAYCKYKAIAIPQPKESAWKNYCRCHICGGESTPEELIGKDFTDDEYGKVSIFQPYICNECGAVGTVTVEKESCIIRFHWAEKSAPAAHKGAHRNTNNKTLVIIA